MGVELWRFGPTPDVELREFGDAAKRYEDLGWDGLSISSGTLPGTKMSRPPGHGGTLRHHPPHSPHAALALAAASTSTLKLGTSASVPSLPPHQAAAAIETLHVISQGRVLHSFARGDGAMLETRRPHGITVDEFDTYLGRIQDYLRRSDEDEAAVAEGESWGIDWQRSLEKPLIDVSATGPRMIRLAARLADGVSFAVGADTERLGACIATVRATRDESGLSAQPFQIGCYVSVAVVGDDDRTRGRDLVRGAVHVHARFSAIKGAAMDGLAPQDREAIERIGRSGHAINRGYDAEGLVDDALIDRFAIVGPAEECAARLQAISETGVDRIIVLVSSPGKDPEDKSSETFAREVIPLLK